MIETTVRERELTIPGTSDQLVKARKFIARTAQACGFDEAKTYDLQVAVGEAVANAIEHGSLPEKTGFVRIICLQSDEALMVTIVDQGVFKKAIPKPDSQINSRGHGILLMLALMDKVSIDESPDGTRVTLSKRY